MDGSSKQHGGEQDQQGCPSQFELPNRYNYSSARGGRRRRSFAEGDHCNLAEKRLLSGEWQSLAASLTVQVQGCGGNVQYENVWNIKN